MTTNPYAATGISAGRPPRPRKPRPPRPPGPEVVEFSVIGSALGFLSFSHYEAGFEARFLRLPMSFSLEYLSIPGRQKTLIETQTIHSYSVTVRDDPTGTDGPDPQGAAFSPHFLSRNKLGEFFIGPMIGLDTEMLPIKLKINDTGAGTHTSYNDPRAVKYILLGAEIGYRIPIWNRFFANAGARYLFQDNVYSPNANGDGSYTQSVPLGVDVPGYQIMTLSLQLGYTFY